MDHRLYLKDSCQLDHQLGTVIFSTELSISLAFVLDLCSSSNYAVQLSVALLALDHEFDRLLRITVAQLAK